MPRIVLGCVCLTDPKNPLVVTQLKGVILSVGLFLAPQVTSADEPRNLSLLKREITAYVDSGRYDEDIATVAQSVMPYLTQRAQSAALAAGPRERLAIVLDIDETILSNLPHMRALDFGDVASEWIAWVARAEAPAIEPVKKIFIAARRLRIDVIFLSGRRERDRPGTEQNLRGVGVWDYAGLVLRPEDSRETNREFKTAARRKLREEGWTIVANVGDQASDLEGGYAERTFKLPAPFYLAP